MNHDRTGVPHRAVFLQWLYSVPVFSLIASPPEIDPPKRGKPNTRWIMKVLM